jgi:hypothetical protein
MGVIVLAGGCGNLPLDEVSFDLDTLLGLFEVRAGVPEANTGSLSPPQGLTPGVRSLSIDPTEITITPDSVGAGKTSIALQSTGSCLTDCGAAGVDAIRCANVCNGRELDIVVWIVSVLDADVVCGEGDGFGVFRVELDEAFAPTTVAPTSIPLTDAAAALINAGDARVCIEVIAPLDGRVRISSLTMGTTE